MEKYEASWRKTKLLSPARATTLLDPDPLLWVHATLIDSGMVAYDNFVAPLSPVEASRYYEESKILARLFDIPEGLVPASLADFQVYMKATLAGNQIAVGTQRANASTGNSIPSPRS